MRRATTRAQPRILLRFTGPGRTLALAAAGVAAGALLVSCAALEGTPLFTDLRTIEPIHGSASAGAQKSTVCASCHGAGGQGGVGPELHGENTRKDTAGTILWIKNPILPMPTLYPKRLSEKDVADIAAYVESL